MGLFSFMYYSSFIAVHKASVGGVIETAVHGLEADEVVEVIKGLGKYLVGQRQVREEILDCLNGVIAKRR